MKVDGREIVRRLGRCAVTCRMIFDAQLARIHNHAQISVVLIVVVLKNYLIGLAVRLLNNLRRA
jgi:hypothetical protein